MHITQPTISPSLLPGIGGDIYNVLPHSQMMGIPGVVPANTTLISGLENTTSDQQNGISHKREFM